MSAIIAAELWAVGWLATTLYAWHWHAHRYGAPDDEVALSLGLMFVLWWAFLAQKALRRANRWLAS